MTLFYINLVKFRQVVLESYFYSAPGLDLHPLALKIVQTSSNRQDVFYSALKNEYGKLDF